jgi:hypothetical protein
MSNQKMYTFDWWLKWISTAILIAGAILTSFDITPWNKWLSFIGNFGWMVVGYIWNEMSLVVISLVLTIIYIIGMFY